MMLLTEAVSANREQKLLKWRDKSDTLDSRALPAA